ncbi:FG-GAP repeat domain-containing protein [Streptomyces rubellomurinus]|uniref:FG-GAP repeat domain-containing protein n=1 Tax=Streptomyces rubellomurinus (strain ATCC 31215) TaxID=359131 RepID=UPI00099DE14E|nr:VCBS repeat-containing protein [Streptomyces rubellomurinus]
MLVAGLTFSVGQASAVTYDAIRVQNKATGLCIQATSSWSANPIEMTPCGSSDDQYFSIINHNWFDDVAVPGGGSCLATDAYANAVSVACGADGYTFPWTYGFDTGNNWTLMGSPAGCYLKVLNNKTPACMPGNSGDNALWRAVKRPISHHNGTEGGNGRVKWADFWGRGKDDYITIGSTGAVTVWTNNGGDTGGGWGSPVQVATGLGSDPNRARLADFDGDGLSDYIYINPDGSVHVYLNRGGDTGGGWQDLGIVATGLTTDISRVRFADIDGDGRADYNVINGDGSVTTYLNRGGDTGAGWVNYGKIATGLTTDPSRVRFADIDGDGKADYSVITGSGAVLTYLNRGGDGHGGWANYGQIATGTTTNQNAVVLADFTGDGKADFITTNPNGSVGVYRNDGGDGHGGWTNLGQVATGA